MMLFLKWIPGFVQFSLSTLHCGYTCSNALLYLQTLTPAAGRGVSHAIHHAVPTASISRWGGQVSDDAKQGIFGFLSQESYQNLSKINFE